MQQERFDSVLPVVSECNPGESMVSDKILKELAPGLTPSCFQISTGFSNGRSVGEEGNSEPVGQVPNELFILIGLCTAKRVIQMSDREVVAEFVESQQKSRRVRPPGNTCQNAIPRCEHAISGNCFADLAD
jgi:hypothetical protein